MIRHGASAKARRARSGVPGMLGIVRLYGGDLTALRNDCWTRDAGICQSCGERTFKDARFDGDPLAYDMAHIGNRRNHGDALDNVRVLCHRCHMREHSGGKPVPKK
jgi:5-methylcytosine-specific restriction endonuclease McrA